MIAVNIKQHGLGMYKQSREYRINKVYSDTINGLEKDLKNCNLEDSLSIQEILKNKYSFDIGYSFYVINSSGKVTAGTNKGIISVDKSEIINGKREYSESKADKNVFKLIGCDKLSEGYYLYYVFLKYGEDDTELVFYALIGSIICFLLFIWGRISYITKIKSVAVKIASGDLTQRVPVKYSDELRELAEGVNFMASKLENEDKRKNEFLTNISHDIRTPLTTILGYVDMLRRRKYDSDEEMNKYLDIIKRKGVFLASMMEDFFEYSKLASKDVTLNSQQIELNELARQLYDDEVNNFSDRSLKLKMELSKEPISVVCDCELILRAINNLISNSLKYSKPDTVVFMKISNEKIEDESYGVFTLKNIPKELIVKEEVKHFFDRLYKKDSARSEEGSGLGLSIVKNIVRLHDGKIISYVDGEYITFKLALKV